MVKIPKKMYKEAIFRWNCFVGCRKFWCIYCKKSFQAQMRRQIHNCEKCGNYIPHFHEERVTKEYTEKHFPETSGDEFIWVGSSGDISFIEYPDMLKILNRIKEYPDRAFFFQTKNPKFFSKFIFPPNVILGITLESDIYYRKISNAPSPFSRFFWFEKLDFPRKFVTIEPILEFNFSFFLELLKELNPERIYVGYDTHKSWWMDGKEKVYLREYEPSLEKTKKLILELERFTKVKTKYMKG